MKRAALAAALLLVTTAVTRAHTVIPGVGGFPGGLLHPLLVPAHTLTLIALGLLLGTYTIARAAALIVTLAVAAAGAFGLIASAYSATNAEVLLLCLCAATGLLLAANFLPPFPVACALTIATAGALMFDSVPPVLTVSETALSLAGTALSALALVAATAWLTKALPQRVGSIAIRIAGSWIAASAVMALALRFAA